ncbi:MAG: hypothetical protein ACK42D_02205 [Candidatus Paceibacteria bacterium]
MSSTNYSLQSDSVNFGGGYSSSSSYILESTVGEIAAGESGSASYQLRAGYQQMQEVYISLTVPGPVNLSPGILGVTGGTSSGFATAATVVTDSPSGYTLAVRAEGSPAMQSALGSIADYAPIGSVPDFEFQLSPTDAVFGFTPEGDDVDIRYQDNGMICGVSGGNTAERCWDGLSTSSKIIARGNGANHPVGASTTLRFQVGLGGMIAVPPGMYVATSTLIAVPQ